MPPSAYFSKSITSAIHHKQNKQKPTAQEMAISKTTVMPMLTIKKIPPEVLDKILGHLDLADLKCTRLVPKRLSYVERIFLSQRRSVLQGQRPHGYWPRLEATKPFVAPSKSLYLTCYRLEATTTHVSGIKKDYEISL